MAEEKSNGGNSIRVVVSRWSKAYKILLAACLFSMLIGTGTSIFFFIKWYQAEQRYTDIRRENSQSKQKFEFLKRDYEMMLREESIIRDVNAHIINLKDPTGKSNSYARIYWNRFSGEVFIDVLFLPVPPLGKEYHVWIFDNNVPSEAGTFKVTFDNRLQSLYSVVTADSWAVSLDPEGGSKELLEENIVLRSEKN
jgi:Anti-sigma-K factor rskA, C-terminal